MEFSFSCVMRNEGILSSKGVYKIVNKLNNKWYVGSTGENFARRFSGHRQSLRKGHHTNPYLQNSYNKYGESNFCFVIVSCCKIDELLIEEQKVLDEHWGCSYCYNISKDSSAPMRGRKHSLDTIQKLRRHSKSRAKEIGECTRKHRTGSKHSKLTIEKMTNSAQNRDDSNRIASLQTDEYRRRMSEMQKGIKWTEETHAKMLVIQQSSEYKRKMSLAKKGVLHSDEVKKKMSLGRMGKIVTLVHEDGQKEDVVSLRNFSEKHKIDRKELSKLINGNRDFYRGWKVLK